MPARINQLLRLLAGGLLVFAACTNDVSAPPCLGDIEIDAPAEVVAGQNFTATASHRGDGCLNSITWEAQGQIELLSAEGVQADFHATEPGEGTIIVQNTHGSRGVVTVDVDEPDPGEPVVRLHVATLGALLRRLVRVHS